jgi:putative transposase
MFKAPMGQEPVGPNPTDQGKNGSKCHLLVDGRGVPLLIVVTSANVNDGKRGWSRSSRRSRSSAAASTCVPTLAIAAPSCWNHRMARRLYHHVVDRHQESIAKQRQPGKKALRWVVEVCRSWPNRLRKPLERYEKLESSFMALNPLAAAMIAFRKVPLPSTLRIGSKRYPAACANLVAWTHATAPITAAC